MVTLQQILDSLAVPTAFSRHDKIADTTVLTELYAWRSNTKSLLDQLDSFDVSTLSTAELANLVSVLAPLTAIGHWSSSAARSAASARLSRIFASNELVAHILSQVIKPFFASTPHPRLHTTTARVLPRPADVQDTYVEQPWKEHPGLEETIRWCLLNTETSAYETVWPLFLPPVMTFLDDYQVPYKLLGVRLVSDMLYRVSPHLLLRTGVDTLIFNSLTNSLSHLGDQSTPDFIRSAVMTTIQLIDITTPSVFSSYTVSLESHTPSPALTDSQSKSLSIRFSRLSTLLSSSLLGTVITYTPTFLPPVSSSVPGPDPFADPEHEGTSMVHVPEAPPQLPTSRRPSFNPTLIAAAQSLPPTLSALGIGGVRFLKGIIPVLVEWLSMPLLVVAAEVPHTSNDVEAATAPSNVEETDGNSELLAVDASLHLASLASLSVLFHTCTPRIGGWSTTILDAIGRCWVRCLDIDGQRRDVFEKENLHALKKQLRETTIQLGNIHPEVVQNEYFTLLTFNHDLFRGMVIHPVILHNFPWCLKEADVNGVTSVNCVIRHMSLK